MNNVSEVFNRTILVARDKPILTMCEWIRNYLMNKNTSLRESIYRWKHIIMYRPRLILDKEVKNEGNWTQSWYGETMRQVEHVHTIHSFIVDTSKRTCTCNLWELVGILCRHAIFALRFKNQHPEEFVDDYYSKDTYVTCYSFNVSPINGHDIWPKVDVEKCYLQPTREDLEDQKI